MDIGKQQRVIIVEPIDIPSNPARIAKATQASVETIKPDEKIESPSNASNLPTGSAVPQPTERP